MRRLNLVLIILIALVFGAQPVSAQDVWVHTDGNGGEYYVVTESLVNETSY